MTYRELYAKHAVLESLAKTVHKRHCPEALLEFEHVPIYHCRYDPCDVREHPELCAECWDREIPEIQRIGNQSPVPMREIRKRVCPVDREKLLDGLKCWTDVIGSTRSRPCQTCQHHTPGGYCIEQFCQGALDYIEYLEQVAFGETVPHEE